jgi:hypothetical protein
MSVELATPITAADEQQLRTKLRKVESVTLMSFRGKSISIHLRVRAKEEVLDVLRDHGLEVERVDIP